MFAPTFNIIGTVTLYRKEVGRFLKVWMQTLMAPAVTTLLFLAIFVLAMRDGHEVVPGVSFVTFLVPGLLMMAMTQNAFANTSSSLIIGKVNGSIVDILLPPLSALEMVSAFALGGVTRGVMVGLSVGIIMACVVPVGLYHLGWLLYFTISGTLLLALLGILTGIWAEKFDQVALVTNFIVTPLSFLSGTFYSVEALPRVWYTLAHVNPFFFMMDGMRYAMTGYSDANIVTGALVLLAANIVLGSLCYALLKAGYKMKS
jgi:ABC-2 type transport system permease protein